MHVMYAIFSFEKIQNGKRRKEWETSCRRLSMSIRGFLKYSKTRMTTKRKKNRKKD